LYTTTCEGFIASTGRGIQGATSHCLGQNFSKMFDIRVDDPDNEGQKLCVWQNSWGLSTRSIGVMVMVHGDDKGLVIPPKVCHIQVVFVPCGLGDKESISAVEIACSEAADKLKKFGFRTKVDLRENYSTGYKFNHWELRGVPLRIEIGPKDLAKNEVVAVRRDNGAKIVISQDGFENSVKDLLDTIQREMFEKAKSQLDEGVKIVSEWSDFLKQLNDKRLIMAPWCEAVKCEEGIKENSSKSTESDEPEDERAPSMGAKSLCIPYNQPSSPAIDPAKTKCIGCDALAKRYTLFGRSY